MTRPRFRRLLVTCEHASNAVPRAYDRLFRGRRDVLKTHRAWDPGAAELARELAHEQGAVVHYGEFTRLLIDLNRRETSEAVFSEFTPASARASLIEYHRRWRGRILECLAVDAGPLLHVSCHSFTPIWKAHERRVDIGILFDPRRGLETETAKAWRHELRMALPDLRIRRNNPYRGISDGTTSWLRGQCVPGQYAGIEIELNQKFAARPAPRWAHIRAALLKVIGGSLQV